MSSNVFDSLRSSCVNTNPLNPSDHRDISVWINTTVISRNTAEYQGSFKNKVAQHKVTEDDINEYKKYMDDLTDNIHIDPIFSVWMILFVMTLIIIFVLNIYVSNWLPTTVPNSRPSRHMMREPESTLLLTTLKSTTSPSDWEMRRSILKAKPCALGPDGIHNNLLKHLPEDTLKIFKEILNNIWISGESGNCDPHPQTK